MATGPLLDTLICLIEVQLVSATGSANNPWNGPAPGAAEATLAPAAAHPATLQRRPCISCTAELHAQPPLSAQPWSLARPLQPAQPPARSALSTLCAQALQCLDRDSSHVPPDADVLRHYSLPDLDLPGVLPPSVEPGTRAPAPASLAGMGRSPGSTAAACPAPLALQAPQQPRQRHYSSCRRQQHAVHLPLPRGQQPAATRITDCQAIPAHGHMQWFCLWICWPGRTWTLQACLTSSAPITTQNTQHNHKAAARCLSSQLLPACWPSCSAQPSRPSIAHAPSTSCVLPCCRY